MPSDYKSTETAIIFQKDWSIKLHQNKHCWCERPWIHEAFVLWIRQMKLFSTRIFKLFSAQLRTVSVWQSLSVRHIFLQTTALVEEPNLRHPLVAFITTVTSEASKTLLYVQDPELFWHIEFCIYKLCRNIKYINWNLFPFSLRPWQAKKYSSSPRRRNNPKMGTAASLRLPHTWDMSRWLPKGFRNLQVFSRKNIPMRCVWKKSRNWTHPKNTG